MAKKLESWLADIFPGREKIGSAYSHLSDRELAVVAASVLDLALAELLSKRLKNYPKECEEFLGLNADGRAPCGSFGARIQLSLLTGIISTTIAMALRDVKNIRNKFAHRVNCTFISPEVVPLVLSLLDRLMDTCEEVVEPEKALEFRKRLKIVMHAHKKDFHVDPKLGAEVVRSALTAYQIQLHKTAQTLAQLT